MENQNSSKSNIPILLKARDVASRLNISRSKAYQLMQTGDIPTIRFDGNVRVIDNDLDEYIIRHRSDWK